MPVRPLRHLSRNPSYVASRRSCDASSPHRPHPPHNIPIQPVRRSHVRWRAGHPSKGRQRVHHRFTGGRALEGGNPRRATSARARRGRRSPSRMFHGGGRIRRPSSSLRSDSGSAIRSSQGGRDSYPSSLSTQKSELRQILPLSALYQRSTEEVGFEPTVPCGTTVFKTAAFGHSATPP